MSRMDLSGTHLVPDDGPRFVYLCTECDWASPPLRARVREEIVAEAQGHDHHRLSAPYVVRGDRD